MCFSMVESLEISIFKLWASFDHLNSCHSLFVFRSNSRSETWVSQENLLIWCRDASMRANAWLNVSCSRCYETHRSSWESNWYDSRTTQVLLKPTSLLLWTKLLDSKTTPSSISEMQSPMERSDHCLFIKRSLLSFKVSVSLQRQFRLLILENSKCCYNVDIWDSESFGRFFLLILCSIFKNKVFLYLSIGSLRSKIYF